MSFAMAIERDNCIGDAPEIEGVSFACHGGAWHSNTSIHMPHCTYARVNGPVVVNGDLTMGYKALITYEPPDLLTSPLITVRGCIHFNHSFINVNLTREINKEIVYADKIKQKNHWLYLLPIEASCEGVDVSTLSFQSEIHWDYGIQINSTLITSKKTPITFFEIQPGHTAIQLGFLGGSPSGPQTWFYALLAITLVFLLIVIAGEIIQIVTARSIKQKMAKTPGNPNINGDSSMVSLLDDTD
jgi:hypothetical protein